MTSTDTPPLADRQARAADLLVDGLVRRDAGDVRALFHGPADIDDPAAGRQVDGGFDRLVGEWAPATLATVVSVQRTHHTSGRDGRFAATEFHLVLDLDGRPQDLDVVVVNEFDDAGGLVRTRLYYRLARVTGVQHVRTRILPEEPVHLEDYSPVLAEYHRALRAGDAEAQAATMSQDGFFTGHGQSQDLRDGLGMGEYHGREAITALLRQMFEVGDEEAGYEGPAHAGTNLEHLNVIDDGTTTVLEFNIIHVNHPVNRTSAGVAAYELGADGLLQEARIYDEAW